MKFARLSDARGCVMEWGRHLAVVFMHRERIALIIVGNPE